MSFTLPRVALRRSFKLPGSGAGKRFESTTTKATESAKETASKAGDKAKEMQSKAGDKAKEMQSKASEGLSRVTATAGPAISNAAQGVSNALGRVGGRTGRMISFVERQIPPMIYYARVGRELARLVFQGQKMSPPPVSTFQSYFQRVVKSVRNPSSLVPGQSPESMLQRMRNFNSTDMVAGAVVGAELLGFFTVGEMLGRMKLVGYHGEVEHHH